MMKKTVSLPLVYRVAVTTEVLVYFILLALTLNFVADSKVKIVLISLLTALLLVSFLVVFLTKKQLDLYTTTITTTLDKMTYGREKVVFEEDKETLLAKLQVKLTRLYDMIENEARMNEQDKENIQGLVSDISHQAKTPITNIKMYYQILDERGEDIPAAKKKEFYLLIEQQIEKLDFLIDSMVKMSRLESGILKIVPTLNPIDPILQNAVETASVKAAQKNIEVTVTGDRGLQLKCDPKWTLEAVLNLLENAVKYTPNNGKVTVSVTKWEMYTKIDIADTGMGIAEEHQGAIFKRFFRAPEVYNVEGVGIGLYLTREIVQKQSGYIEVKSKLDEGSTFSVFLLNG